MVPGEAEGARSQGGADCLMGREWSYGFGSSRWSQEIHTPLQSWKPWGSRHYKITWLSQRRSQGAILDQHSRHRRTGQFSWRRKGWVGQSTMAGTWSWAGPAVTEKTWWWEDWRWTTRGGRGSWVWTRVGNGSAESQSISNSHRHRCINLLTHLVRLGVRLCFWDRHGCKSMAGICWVSRSVVGSGSLSMVDVVTGSRVAVMDEISKGFCTLQSMQNGFSTHFSTHVR